MYSVVAVAGYRCLREVIVPLGRLTVVTGPNGSGKSSLYRALRLLADCGLGRVVASLAREGGLPSALWAGPETLQSARRTGVVQGTVRKGPISLRLGVAGPELGYLVDLGLPPQAPGATSYFLRDPDLKREAIWHGPVMRPATLVARRRRHVVELRTAAGRWVPGEVELPAHASMLAEYGDAGAAPALWAVRRELAAWRFYDGFRADAQAPARRPAVGTRTAALADDGADLAAALATILEDGRAPLGRFVAEAFEGAEVRAQAADGVFDVVLHQRGMLRGLRSAELSDGTLRYLLWLAALLTPAPPPLLVVNEPETSLHPSLLGPLAGLIADAARRTQIVVVTHSAALLAELGRAYPGLGDDASDDPTRPGEIPAARLVRLAKDLGETRVEGQGLMTTPLWEWGHR
ncbi:MAG: AAA family ATPase [Austwickia sp.]|nr:MAG: AAA family ATPase [Austwickia sp.]